MPKGGFEPAEEARKLALRSKSSTRNPWRKRLASKRGNQADIPVGNFTRLGDHRVNPSTNDWVFVPEVASAGEWGIYRGEKADMSQNASVPLALKNRRMAFVVDTFYLRAGTKRR